VISDFGSRILIQNSLAQTVHIVMCYLSGFSLQAMLQCNSSIRTRVGRSKSSKFRDLGIGGFSILDKRDTVHMRRDG